MTDSSDIKVAQDVHHRLEFYLVALAFTVSGFAMQTGKFIGLPLADICEATSWILLFISGLIGLWRLEYIPVLYRTNVQLDAKKLYIRGANSPSDPNIIALQKQIDEFSPKFSAMEKGNFRKYFWQKSTLVLGLLALLIARVLAQANQWY